MASPEQLSRRKFLGLLGGMALGTLAIEPTIKSGTELYNISREKADLLAIKENALLRINVDWVINSSTLPTHPTDPKIIAKKTALAEKRGTDIQTFKDYFQDVHEPTLSKLENSLSKLVTDTLICIAALGSSFALVIACAQKTKSFAKQAIDEAERIVREHKISKEQKQS